MALFSRKKSKEELEEDIDRTAAGKKAYRQAKIVEDLAAALLEEARKLTEETSK